MNKPIKTTTISNDFTNSPNCCPKKKIKNKPKNEKLNNQSNKSN